MTRNEIFTKLNEVFRDVFDNTGITVGEQTVAADIGGWDSLMHITLMQAIEDEFEVHFAMKEIVNLHNVGEIVDILTKKM